jgi:hypothetical protein
MAKNRGDHFVRYVPGFFSVGERRFGVEFSRVSLTCEGELPVPYLDRYIVYFGRHCLRLHKFYRGDDDRAPHTHPFDFWTFPLAEYRELVSVPRVSTTGTPFTQNFIAKVRAFKWHYRPHKYRHIVLGRADGLKKPFWTIVFARFRSADWGFWTSPTTYVSYKDWK